MMRAIAIQAHHAVDAGGLDFKADDVIYVTEQHPSGWWGGYKERAWDKVGWFPGQRVRLCESVGTAVSMADQTSQFVEPILAACGGADVAGGASRRCVQRGE